MHRGNINSELTYVRACLQQTLVDMEKARAGPDDPAARPGGPEEPRPPAETAESERKAA